MTNKDETLGTTTKIRQTTPLSFIVISINSLGDERLSVVGIKFAECTAAYTITKDSHD